MKSNNCFTEKQIDLLKEMTSICMTHAATALSQMLGRPIYLKLPVTAVSPFEKMDSLLADPEQLVAAVQLQIVGKVRGSIVLIFTAEGMRSMLAALVPGDKENGQALTELQLSSLKEVGNILASAFLNALGSLLQMTLLPSVPDLSVGRADVVVGNLLTQENVLSVVAEADLDADAGQILGHLLLLPDQLSFKETFLSFNDTPSR